MFSACRQCYDTYEVSILIYLLEDDESIRKLVIYALESQNFKALGFETPEQFWKKGNCRSGSKKRWVRAAMIRSSI